MDQILRGTANTIRATIVDGELPVPGLTSVSLEVTASDGTHLVTDGEADADDTAWKYVLGPVAEVDELTAVWTGVDGDDNTWATTTTIEVVGGFYFPIAALQDLPAVVNKGERYTPGDYIEARQWIEALIETVCSGVTFVERYRAKTVTRARCERRGHGPVVQLLYPRRILGVSLDGTPLTDDELAAVDLNDLGQLTGLTGPTTDTWTTAVIRYVTGYSTEPEPDLRSAALTAAKNHLTTIRGGSGISDRALSVSTSEGVVRNAVAGAGDYPTGLPTPDAAIVRWRNKVAPAMVA